MAENPESRTENYNEIIVEFGWIVLFPPACPVAALIAIVSNMIQYKTEKDATRMFMKRGIPQGCMDIGKWLEYFELITTFGVVNSALLVIFTSDMPLSSTTSALTLGIFTSKVPSSSTISLLGLVILVSEGRWSIVEGLCNVSGGL